MSEPAIIEAIHNGDVERVQAIVSSNPAAARARSSSGVSALLEARYRFRMDIVDLLLGVAGDLDVFEASALGRIAELERQLRRDPASVNAWSSDGFQPLHLAAFFGQTEAARVLLAGGADPNGASRNAMEVHPINSAAATKQREIVELLLDAGADVDAVQHGGWSALHSAAHNGDRETAMLLTGRGADRTARASTGQTPADMAEEKGFTEVAAMLR